LVGFLRRRDIELTFTGEFQAVDRELREHVARARPMMGLATLDAPIFRRLVEGLPVLGDGVTRTSDGGQSCGPFIVRIR
jgi:hypothetical protein